MPERVLSLARDVGRIASQQVSAIQNVTRRTKILAINALIEASTAGTHGAGFAVVANEIKEISHEIDLHANDLTKNIEQRLNELNQLGDELVADIYGRRLSDLAFNLIEIMDRNLYERSCDVRWWATDAAVVEACSNSSPELRAKTSQRLGVILDAYTVYLDLWVCDLQGNVITTGRPSRFIGASQSNVADQPWFRQAISSKSGDDYAVSDISRVPQLDNRLVATYAAAVRAGGEKNAQPIGVIGIFFDWQTQAQAVVNGVRLSEKERARTRCLIVDSHHRVIASSDNRGVLEETLPLVIGDKNVGHYRDKSQDVGFAKTPGYETYPGLGWLGVITQRLTE